MTKSELKDIIYECLEEEGMFGFEEDAVLEQALFMEDACFSALNAIDRDIVSEAVVRDKHGNIDSKASVASVSGVRLQDYFDAKKTVEEVKADEARIAAELAACKDLPDAKNKAADKVASKLGKGFKSVGGKIVSIYSGKDGHGKQAVAIAATATAIAGTIAAIAMKMKKKKQKEEEKED